MQIFENSINQNASKMFLINTGCSDNCIIVFWFYGFKINHFQWILVILGGLLHWPIVVFRTCDVLVIIQSLSSAKYWMDNSCIVWFAAMCMPMNGCRQNAPNKGLALKGCKQTNHRHKYQKILCHERELGVIDIPSDCQHIISCFRDLMC